MTGLAPLPVRTAILETLAQIAARTGDPVPHAKTATRRWTCCLPATRIAPVRADFRRLRM